MTLLPICLVAAAWAGGDPTIAVELREGLSDKAPFDMSYGRVVERYVEPAFALPAVPEKYTPRGLVADRPAPYAVRATARFAMPAGKYRFLLRSRVPARLYVDNQLLVQTPGVTVGGDGSTGNEAFGLPEPLDPALPALKLGDAEKLVPLTLNDQPHQYRFEILIGSKKLRPEPGEPVVAISREMGPWQILSPTGDQPFTEEAWEAYQRAAEKRHAARNTRNRRQMAASEDSVWSQRHELARQLWSARPAPAVPPASKRLPATSPVDHFLNAKLDAESIEVPAVIDDLGFLRRLTLDTAGVIPTSEEVAAFQADPPAERRTKAIERLLADPRWADHWTSYWQDVLAENPGVLKPLLNNTGPFRTYIYQSFLDNKPLDRFATDLVRMEGSLEFGGAAGFSMASQNDAPMAAKAQILTRAFLSADLTCARCHDAPGRSGFKQQQLFGLAAMLERKTITLPKTSTVPPPPPGGRVPHVKITLKPGAKIDPEWKLPGVAGEALPAGVSTPADAREHFAALLTSAENSRFAEVAVNRLWARWLGWGLIDPVDDWADADERYPELLQWLARELVLHNYDLKHVARLILSSTAYQRLPSEADDTARLAGPARRRMTAEQLLDSLFVAAGKEFHCEQLTFDPDTRRPVSQMKNLGAPRRAWQFAQLGQERDRPSLALPTAQGFVDLLSAFGWRESRPDAVTIRDHDPTPLQPMALANGLMAVRVARLSDDSALTTLALEDQPLTDLIDRLYQRWLTRLSTTEERTLFEDLLRDGYDRRQTGAPAKPRRTIPRLVSWSNHLKSEANTARLDQERLVREGDPPTDRLAADWRERMEDAVWALMNSPEFLFVP